MTDREHHLDLLIRADSVCAALAGFLSVIMEIGALAPCHHAQANKLLERAKAINASPLFPSAERTAS